MAIEKIIRRIVVDVDNHNGRHKVTVSGVLHDPDSELDDKNYSEPFARNDLLDLLVTDVGINAELVNTLTTDLDAKDAELTTAVAALAQLQASVTAKDAEIVALKAEIEALKTPPVVDPTIPAAVMRLRLIDLGKFPEQVQAVLDAVRAQSETAYQKLNTVWEYSVLYYLSDTRITTFGLQLGLTEEQISDIFLLSNADWSAKYNGE